MAALSRREPQKAIARRLRRQANACSHLGSSLYANLLTETAQDVERGGPSWRVLEGHENDPPGSALALRLMGAVHRLVLEHRAPELARYYPSVGGTVNTSRVWRAFVGVLDRQRDAVQALLPRPVQTNEVRRSRALLGGFLHVARAAGLPLSLLEVGASAGLNLRWDHFRYEVCGQVWGDPTSPLCLRGGFVGVPPSFDLPVQVSARHGCDIAPVDPSTPEGHLTLLSYIWADQVERITQLEAAIEVAKRVPARVDRADGTAWLDDRLREDELGIARVVYHSIVMQYLREDDRRRWVEVIREAGTRATWSSPLAWLRMEPAGDHADVYLTLWPEGSEYLLAHSGYHGETVRWLGSDAGSDRRVQRQTANGRQERPLRSTSRGTECVR